MERCLRRAVGPTVLSGCTKRKVVGIIPGRAVRFKVFLASCCGEGAGPREQPMVIAAHRFIQMVRMYT